MTVFICGRPKQPRCPSPCCEPAIARCAFELMGRRSGEICGVLVCVKHNQIVDGKRLCLAHARMKGVVK